MPLNRRFLAGSISNNISAIDEKVCGWFQIGLEEKVCGWLARNEQKKTDDGLVICFLEGPEGYRLFGIKEIADSLEVSFKISFFGYAWVHDAGLVLGVIHFHSVANFVGK